MGDEFMDAEIFAAFVIEAREHLESIEPNLLELEKEPDNLTLLDDIFRPMHSLKGASGFLGLNKINSLAHKGENVLDELRKGRMRATSGIMDAILQATDLLREMIDNLDEAATEGDVDTSEVEQRFQQILEGKGEEAVSSTESKSEEMTETSEAEAVSGAEEAEEESEVELQSLESYHLTVGSPAHLHNFYEEVEETVEKLSDVLVQLEKSDGEEQKGLVDDIFRYFHNLKGNSGIIGYKEFNALTHEAETLLNDVRKGEIVVSQFVIDLLLETLDLMEKLAEGINIDTADVTPIDISFSVKKLQECIKTKGGFSDAGVSKRVVKEENDDLIIFKDTVDQQLSAIYKALEILEKDGSNKESIDSLYRSLVTIQNSACYMEEENLKVYAERTAGLVEQARNSEMDFSDMHDILKQETGIIEQMVEKFIAAHENTSVAEEIKPESAPAPKPETKPAAKPEIKSETKSEVKPAAKSAPAPKPATAPKASDASAAAAKSKSSSTVRVDHEKLDHLMNLIGELIINRNRFAMLARSLEEQHDPAEIAQQLTETTYSMARISDDLQDTIMAVRMVPVQTVFSRFPRLIRDLSKKSNKNVELIMSGEDTGLDKSVAETIGDPLVHLIRNSVDHGLEPEADRIAAGKDPVGKVWLRASHQGNSVVIEVEDDGRGIDPEKTKAKALEKGLITDDDARNMDDRTAVDLIFAAGFSTAEKITDISGRGVGMDVVRSNIKDLKGSVTVQTELGKGSIFTLSLPLTLAIIDALMVTVHGDTFAIPLDSVSETTKVEIGCLKEINQRRALTLRNEVVGIVDLADLLGFEKKEDNRELLPIVILTVNDRKVGLVVDRLLERQEIVIKTLGSYLGALHGISGATIMGDGGVTLILDPHEIYKIATMQGTL